MVFMCWAVVVGGGDGGGVCVPHLVNEIQFIEQQYPRYGMTAS